MKTLFILLLLTGTSYAATITITVPDTKVASIDAAIAEYNLVNGTSVNRKQIGKIALRDFVNYWKLRATRKTKIAEMEAAEVTKKAAIAQAQADIETAKATEESGW